MATTRGSDAAISKIMKTGTRISVSEVSKLASLATAAGGSLIAVDPDGDWCGNGQMRFKWPPKRAEFEKLLDELVVSRINFEVLVNGIPVPDEILVNATRRVRGG